MLYYHCSKGNRKRGRKIKEYTVEVAMSAWAKVIVIAQDEEEAVAKACNVVDLDDVYDWEIDAAEVEDDDE